MYEKLWEPFDQFILKKEMKTEGKLLQRENVGQDTYIQISGEPQKGKGLRHVLEFDSKRCKSYLFLYLRMCLMALLGVPLFCACDTVI